MVIYMKKYSILIACILVVVSISGCGTQQEEKNYEISEAGTWTDGTYIESTKGKNGTFDVTVTILDGEISNIEIGENSETPERGGAAIQQLPSIMIEQQTYDVDAVSGATITSDGIKDAVARSLEKASQ